MKRSIFVILTALGVFIAISFFIMPEYRLRVLFAFVLYAAVCFLFIKAVFWKDVKAGKLLFSLKRVKYLAVYFLIFVLICFISSLLINNRTLSSLRMDLSSDKNTTLSAEAVAYLKALNIDVNIIYVRPTNSGDQSVLFNSIMKEFSVYTNRIKYSTIHPLLNSIEYNSLKNKIASAVPGNF
ncbi:MAG: hypothetical protein V1647_07055, partial [Pseudomonadota bacterium]